ncbi:hypothetical protein NCLIV_061690 [Neospora caninum Liverpool]|uniref:Probable protein phosphatase 2C 31 n=1 Tax=Neospora caninum (strain Liverpool) TaxID=572307 RepID=F0VPU7_NEOCL|nr:hypothetical protein NCLIV_061690 [Neospora caninum Liverpool]CBZ55744.1 hypothetical protein NCLIV_061690 [Neospora caninum Liverpool]CEL70487.1 TPA: Probable protein phosphatase 2C 31 [Neospora caninum Liverpool]|eukprot:XP_003885770.1 hypothetical protein NCLIV_061690 [Neospora caninum Liverpool]
MSSPIPPGSGTPIWGLPVHSSKRALALAVTAASSLVLSSPSLSRLSSSAVPSLSHPSQEARDASACSPLPVAPDELERSGLALRRQNKDTASGPSLCVPRDVPRTQTSALSKNSGRQDSFLHLCRLPGHSWSPAVASFSARVRVAPETRELRSLSDARLLGSSAFLAPVHVSAHHLSPHLSVWAHARSASWASGLSFVSSESARAFSHFPGRGRDVTEKAWVASLDPQPKGQSARSPSPSPFSKSLCSSPPLLASVSSLPPFPSSISSFSPLFLRSLFLLAIASFLASSFSLPSADRRRSPRSSGVASCDEKAPSEGSSSKRSDASFLRSWITKSSAAEDRSSAASGKEANDAGAAPPLAAPACPASSWGNGEGGGILRWRGGGVGRWSEAANAAIEDRSIAVLLAIDGEEEDREDERSGEPSADGDARQEAPEETAQLAALVFPNEIASLLGRRIEEIGWMQERKKKIDKKQKSPGTHAEGKRKTPRQKVLLTAVIDGHGGPQVAEYVMQHLPWHVERELTALRRAFLRKSTMGEDGESSLTDTSWLTNDVLTKAISRAFRALDDEIYQSVSRAYRLGFHRSIRVGACCTAILVTDRSLVVANSGDCKAVLSRRYGAELQALNEQLNANSPAERQRLREEHPNEENVVVCKHSWQEQRKPSSVVDIPLYFAGLLGSSTFYSGCYVKGRLQPTRAFGDFLLKKSEYGHELQRSRRANGASVPSQPLSYPYLTVDPVVAHFDLRGDEDFIVLGSDGVWDFLDDSETARAIHASLQRTKQRAARATLSAGTSFSSGASEQGNDLNASPSRSAGVTSVFSADAARLAAADLVKAVLQRAADERAISVDEMKVQEPKQRRRIYDDTTAVVVLLGQDWRPRPAAKDRR